jgi:hypothetical protein
MLPKYRSVTWRIKRQGRNRFFRPPKCRNVVQRKPCILQQRVSCPLKNLIFRPPKGRTEALWILDTLGWMVSWYLSNRAKSLMTLEVTNYQATKRSNRGFVNARYLWVEGLIYILESRFQPAKMPNRDSVNTRYLGLEGLMTLRNTSVNGITVNVFTKSIQA